VVRINETMSSPSDSQSVIQQLQAEFLKISVVDDANGDGTEVEIPFDEVLKAIREASQCDHCSIWGITIVPSGKGNEMEKCVSLVTRNLHVGSEDVLQRISGHPENFVHKLKNNDPDSFARYILYDTKNGSDKPFSIGTYGVNKSHEILKDFLGKNYVSVGIPIPCHCWQKKGETWERDKGRCQKVKCTEDQKVDDFQGTNFKLGQCVDLVVKGSVF